MISVYAVTALIVPTRDAVGPPTVMIHGAASTWCKMPRQILLSMRSKT
ncbi:hypothetical protein V1281_003852 [Nitrobacteraceae bacterium AZCC 2161]